MAAEPLKIVVKDVLANVLTEVPLADRSLAVGREPSCELTLNSPYVSRLHARIEPAGDGYSLVTCGLNPTYHNQRLLGEREASDLAPGDTISVPGFTLELVDARGSSRSARGSLEMTRRFSELKAGLHQKLLDKMDLRRWSRQDLEEEQRRRQILDLLDELLSKGPVMDSELREFIVLETFAAALRDRLFLDLETVAATSTRADWNRDPLERAFGELVERCARKLDHETTHLPMRERIRILRKRFADAFEENRLALTPDLEDFTIRRTLRHDLEALVFGLGPLEDLLRVPDLEEVMVIGRDRIFVERSGRLEETGRSFPSHDDLDVVIRRIVAPVGRFVNRSQPIVDARLEDGSRVNVAVPPISIHGPAITLRKFRHVPFSLEDLVLAGTLNRRAASFLRGAILARKNVIFAGGTGSGKTTLLNALGSQIPPRERLVVIEDAAELRLPQSNQVVLEARRANVEGEGEITIRELVRNALRMRPDRILVGECRGREALDMLQAMNTGHEGSLTTAHANSPSELIARLEVMVLEAEGGLPLSAVHRQISGALDLIVQIERQRDRSRRITHITEVGEYDAEEGRILLDDVFRASTGGDDQTTLRFTGYLPRFIDELLDNGGISLEELF